MSGTEDQGSQGRDVEAPPAEDAEVDATQTDVGDVPAGGAGADSGAVDAVQVDPESESTIANRGNMNDIPGVGTRDGDGDVERVDEDRP